MSYPVKSRIQRLWLLAWAILPLAAFGQGNFEIDDSNQPTYYLNVTNVYTNIVVNNGATNAVVMTNVGLWPTFLLTNVVIANGTTNLVISTNIFYGVTNGPITPYIPPPPKPWYKRLWDWLFE